MHNISHCFFSFLLYIYYMLYELMLRYLTSHFIRNYDYTFYTITLLILRKKFSFGLEFAALFENWYHFQSYLSLYLRRVFNKVSYVTSFKDTIHSIEAGDFSQIENRNIAAVQSQKFVCLK